jgi:rhamnose utilization protein RhaD (predicted bifunctional aldolase and dehydrogenase)
MQVCLRATKTLGTNPPHLEALLEISARLGRDPLLVQAGTGNTSAKLDGLMWIKASGKWLAHAQDEEILVPVDLAKARECVEADMDLGLARANSFESQLRPSIETAMHAVMPHRITIHVHSVNAIALAVRQDAPARLNERLDGLNWQWIPYVSSGIPLARKIENALAEKPSSSIFVLGNHGLVIGAESCEEADALLSEVERRLAVCPRQAPPPRYPRLASMADDSPWRLPAISATHILGTDPVSRCILSQGFLFPCQAIFLGPGLPIARRSGGLPAEFTNRENPEPAPFLIVEDGGVLVRSDLTGTQAAMLAGLTQVIQRIDPEAPLRYLTPSELAGILQHEASVYRAMVEKNESRCSPC